MNYVEVSFEIDPILPAREVLVAELAELGYESFVESENGLKAYIQEPDFDQAVLSDLMAGQIENQKLTFNTQVIQATNWNAEWEKSFDPIIVDNLCLIKAPFHEINGDFQYVITIEPKMSFGTGHHSTTHLMMSEMMTMDLGGKKVLDMGSGTAVLAILAEMRGAAHIDAIDIDEWAYENGVENAQLNGCKHIDCFKGGAELLTDQKYDVIFANINRNILLRDMHAYANVLNEGGDILFSGFYLQDIPHLKQEAIKHGLSFEHHKERNEWCLVKMKK